MSKYFTSANFIFFVFLLPLIGIAQDGNLDMSFNTPININQTADNGFTKSNLYPGQIVCTKILGNGDLLVYGDFDFYQGVAVSKLVRLHANGILDTSFNVGIGPYAPDNFAGKSLICEQADGKVILVGFPLYNGIERKAVRLNLDGSVDSSFNVTTDTNGEIFSVKLLSDGKMICGGSFSTFNGQSRNGLVKLNANGTTDSSFNIGTGFALDNGIGGRVYSVDVQTDGKILVGGRFLEYNGVPKISLVRLNSNGSIDTGFLIGIGAGPNATNSNFDGTIIKVFYDSQLNQIYYAGNYLTTINGTSTKNVVRLNIDGSVDGSFGFSSAIGNGFTSDFNGTIEELHVLADGRLLVGGSFLINSCVSLALFEQNGTINPSFYFSVLQGSVYSIDSNANSIVVSGEFSDINFYGNAKASIVKILPTGLTDIGFNAHLGVTTNNTCGALFELSDGRILISPTLDKDTNGDNNADQGTYNEVKTTGLVKINSNGSLYEPDYANYLGLGRYSSVLSSDNNGKVLTSLTWTDKINENGTLDNAFSSSGLIVAPNTINLNVFTKTHVVQNDGKIIAGGSFRYILGSNNYRQRIIRLNVNGSMDNNFNVGKGFNGTSLSGTDGYYVKTLAMQPDNKVLVGGQFTDFNDVVVKNITRLQSNGGLDTSFVTGTGCNGRVVDIKFDSNLNKIMVCGYFTNYNNSAANYLMRLNLNGSVDASFNSPFSAAVNSGINKIVIQPDGKYIISGGVNNVPVLYRLNVDGTLDATFNNANTFHYSTTLFSAPDLITDFIMLANSKILVTGHFDRVNNVLRGGIALLGNTPSLGVTQNHYSGQEILIVQNPVRQILEVKDNQNMYKVAVYDIGGRLVKLGALSENKCDVSDLKSGIYLLKVYDEEHVLNSRFIKE